MHGYAEIIKPGHKPDSHVIYQGVRYEDRPINAQEVTGCRFPSDERCDEERATVIDSGNGSNLTDDVEPRSEPAPAFSTEHARPVIHRTRGRQGRSQFSHTHYNGERKERNKRPSQRHLGRPTHF